MNSPMEILRKQFPETSPYRLLASTFLLTLGIFFSYPLHGVAATFPVFFVFALGAFWVKKNFYFTVLVSAAIAAVYGIASVYDGALLFTVFIALSAICAVFTFRALASLFGGQKKKAYLLLFLLPAVLLPVLFWGTPVHWYRAASQFRDYLASRYPDQSFEKLIVYRNAADGTWQCDADYRYQGHILTSRLSLMEDEIRDGYWTDYAEKSLIQYKPVLIESLSDCDSVSAVIEEEGLLYEQDECVWGVYGVDREENHAKMHFRITFRNEMKDRLEFADSCRSVLDELEKDGVIYGVVTFVAQDADQPVYRCEIAYADRSDDPLHRIETA